MSGDKKNGVRGMGLRWLREGIKEVELEEVVE